MKRILFVFTMMFVICGLAISNAHAVPVMGGQIFSTGGEIEIEILNSSAGYTSTLNRYEPTLTEIGTNREAGKVVDLGNFASGVELIFGIYVINTDYTFYMGSGDLNLDNMIYATVDFIEPGVATVAFEDLFGGGDRDYNDNRFQIRGAIGPEQVIESFDPEPNPNPEPATLLFYGSGIATLGVLRRKLQKAY